MLPLPIRQVMKGSMKVEPQLVKYLTLLDEFDENYFSSIEVNHGMLFLWKI